MSTARTTSRSTLDDDPAAEMFAWQGRFLYFHPDEIEVDRREP